VYLQNAMFHATHRNEKAIRTHGRQINTVLKKICKLHIQTYPVNEFHEFWNKNKDNELTIFPLCSFSKIPVYATLWRDILATMLGIQKSYLKNPQNLLGFVPLEAFVLNYMIDLYTKGGYKPSYGPIQFYKIYKYMTDRKNSKISELLHETDKISGLVQKALSTIDKTETETTLWNIEHLVQFEGCNKDIDIQYRANIIGNGKEVYHFMFISDYNSLNYWETNLKILHERFILRNPRGHDKGNLDNKRRFGGKKINTYLFVLKTNEYVVFDWEWDSDDIVKNAIVEGLKKSLNKEFGNYNQSLYNLVNFYIDHPGKLPENSTNPYQAMCLNYKYIPYVHRIFSELDQKVLDGEEVEALSFVQNEAKFMTKTTNRIYQMITRFFGREK